MNTRALSPPHHATSPAEDHEVVRLAVRGMTCAACVNRVERALRKVPGVQEASVNYATETATVHWHTPAAQPASVAPDPDRLVQAVVDAGYNASCQQDDAPPPDDHPGWWRTWGEVTVASLLSLPLMWPMMAGAWQALWHPGAPMQMAMWPAWLQCLLATPVQFWLGARFYKAGWAALRAGTGNMDQLVALGTSAAYGLSLWLWWQHDPAVTQAGHHVEAHPSLELYFESSAVVITLVMWGKALETRAKRQASQAIRGLYALRPTSVIRQGPQGEVEVPLAQVLSGDTLVVRPGARVPADGTVLSGHGHVDESMLTGEPMPVAKSAGSVLTGGTLNQEARLVMRVRAVGQAATLAGIIRRVEQAQATKPPIQQVVDRVSAVFVPVVLVMAALTASVWLWHGASLQQALINAVSVLVMACPCALGLATPAALMAGTGAAARAGILIRDPQALEAAHRARVIAFDKTGTLTEGQPRVVSCLVGPAPDGIPEDARDGVLDDPTSGPSGDTWTPAQALAVAASIQAGSEHPLARAVVKAALTAPTNAASEAVPDASGAAPQTPSLPEAFAAPWPMDEVHAEVGRGVRAHRRAAPWGGQWAVASTPWAAALLGAPSDRLLVALPWAQASQVPGELGEPTEVSVSWLLHRAHNAASWRPVARLAFADAPKPHAAEAIARLQSRGLHTWLISGDRQAAAQGLAQRLGIAQVLAEVLPGDKATQVAALQQAHGTVIMVGDGLNDAPALAQADVSMAMANPGAGNDLALEAAGITLMRGDPLLVEAALDISARTTRKIHQNLAWAFVYNVVGLPLAALGLFNPMLAGAAMALSSISVLLNAITLLRWRPAPALVVNSRPAVRSSTG